MKPINHDDIVCFVRKTRGYSGDYFRGKQKKSLRVLYRAHQKKGLAIPVLVMFSNRPKINASPIINEMGALI